MKMHLDRAKLTSTSKRGTTKLEPYISDAPKIRREISNRYFRELAPGLPHVGRTNRWGRKRAAMAVNRSTELRAHQSRPRAPHSCFRKAEAPRAGIRSAKIGTWQR